MVENKFWSDFGFSVDVNGKLLVSTEKKLLKRDLGEGKGTALPLHMGDKVHFSSSLKFLSPIWNCPNIQSSINHQQHILQIQNTVCLLVFKNATEGQIDPLQWTELLQDRTLHNSLCSRGVISNITQVELWMPLAAALNPSHHPS